MRRSLTPVLILGVGLLGAFVMCERSISEQPATDRPDSARARIAAPDQLVAFLAFTPDGTRLVSVDDLTGAITVRDAKTGQAVHRFDDFKPHNFVWIRTALAPDGETFAVALSRDGIHIGHLETGELTLRVPAPARDTHYTAIAFTPDGRGLVTAEYHGVIRVHESVTGRELRSWSVPGARPFHLALTPDGRTVVVGDHLGRIWCWELETGRNLGTVVGQETVITSLAIAPDGRTLATAAEYNRGGQVRVWDLASLAPGTVLLDQPRLGFGSGLTYSPDGRTLAVSHGYREIALWDTTTGRLLHLLKGHKYNVRALAFSPDGRTLASGGDGDAIILWNVRPAADDRAE